MQLCLHSYCASGTKFCVKLAKNLNPSCGKGIVFLCCHELRWLGVGLIGGVLEWGSGEHHGSATAAVEPQAWLFSDWDKMVSAFVLANLYGVFIWKAKVCACVYGSVPVTSWSM